VDISRTVKDPKGKITLHVWDKDPEDEVKTFSAKFWKEETDDFLGMVNLSLEATLTSFFPLIFFSSPPFPGL